LDRHLLLHHSHSLETKTDWCRTNSTSGTRTELRRTSPLVKADLLHLSMLWREGVSRSTKGQTRCSLRSKILNAGRSIASTVSWLSGTHSWSWIWGTSFALYTRGSLLTA